VAKSDKLFLLWKAIEIYFVALLKSNPFCIPKDCNAYQSRRFLENFAQIEVELGGNQG